MQAELGAKLAMLKDEELALESLTQSTEEHGSRRRLHLDDTTVQQHKKAAREFQQAERAAVREHMRQSESGNKGHRKSLAKGGLTALRG